MLNLPFKDLCMDTYLVSINYVTYMSMACMSLQILLLLLVYFVGSFKIRAGSDSFSLLRIDNVVVDGMFIFCWWRNWDVI